LIIGLVCEVFNKVFGYTIKESLSDLNVEIMSTYTDVTVDMPLVKTLRTVGSVHDFREQSFLIVATQQLIEQIGS
jgi:hypothetical protein